jgi:signal transduction histidine kinase
LLALPGSPSSNPTETIDSALEAARQGLEMEIAYLAEDTDGEHVLRALAGRFEAIELHEGDALPIEDELNRIEHVGACVGVPVQFSDGHLYGSLCCLSHAPHPDVGEREVRFMRVLARVVAGELEREALHREANQLKDDFVALVSHELRTPLASIIANLEVLEDETAQLSPDGRRFVGVIDRNARRLLRLIGQLLFVSQLQAGRLPARFGWVDVDALVQDAVDLARASADARHVALSLEAEPVGRVWADGDRLAQLCDNLLSNAIKFTPEGGSVRVRLETVGSTVRLEVEDTGIGIPGRDQARLFERFYRGTAAIEREVPGTGLGLWISDAVVRLHDGTIAVRTEVGAGTTFTVLLPERHPREAHPPGCTSPDS